MAIIQVVDDSKDLCSMLKLALERDGHQVYTALSGKEVKPELLAKAELILLDVMIPDEDGFSICLRIREVTDCPIIFLSARDQEGDILEGLASGGDDYLTKPFRIAELRARVMAHLRREKRVPQSRYKCGDLIFHFNAKEVTCKGKSLKLTKKEYELCCVLAKNKGTVFSREQLIECAFGFDCEVEHGAVTEHIKNIRMKLSAFGLEPIETVWGIGYKWNPEKTLVL